MSATSTWTSIRSMQNMQWQFGYQHRIARFVPQSCTSIRQIDIIKTNYFTSLQTPSASLSVLNINSVFHAHLSSDLQDIQHQIDKMSIDIALQYRHRHRQSRKIDHKLLMQHLYDHWDQDNGDIILHVRCHEVVEIINKQRAQHRHVSSTSSDLISGKGFRKQNGSQQIQQQHLQIQNHQLVHRHLQHPIGQHRTQYPFVKTTRSVLKHLYLHHGQLHHPHLREKN